MTRPFARALARALLAGATLAAGALRAEPPPPAPTRFVTDSAGLLSEGARQQLDSQLETYERRSGHQVLVWTSRTSAGVPIEDFAVRAFAAWKVGRKGLDDGLVLFVFSDDRSLRIEVGYGLEDEVPDAIASRIIRETIVPRLKAGDADGALRAGVAALLSAIEGRPVPPEPTAAAPGAPGARHPPAGPAPLSTGQALLLGVLVLGFLFLLATNPALALYLLGSVMSGGRGMGDGGGGRYSGQGGRSGGGGASGSW